MYNNCVFSIPYYLSSQKSFTTAWFGFGMYVVLIIFSGWTGIVYSDAMGLIFPTLIIWFYQNRINLINILFGHPLLCWDSGAIT